MKQRLSFSSEQEFQNFFSQLASADMPNFQAVEGAGGDKGFDGLEGETAFQVYYPSEKVNAQKYIKKIDADFDKIVLNMGPLGLRITRWILVVPEDLSINVVAFLKVKSSGTGIKALYWGATKLSEMINKHPHIKESFPTIFLPAVNEGLKTIKSQLVEASRPKVLSNTVEIITDEEFKKRKTEIILANKQKSQSAIGSFGDSSKAQAMIYIHDKNMKEKLEELRNKKSRSDSAYTLEFEEVNRYWDDQISEKKRELVKRGILTSGIGQSELNIFQINKDREIRKVNLKFGVGA